MCLEKDGMITKLQEALDHSIGATTKDVGEHITTLSNTLTRMSITAGAHIDTNTKTHTHTHPL